MIVLLPVAEATHKDIEERIRKLGPEYVRDFFDRHPEHGLVIVFGEVGLVVEKRNV